jgi:hypothetical protein
MWSGGFGKGCEEAFFKELIVLLKSETVARINRFSNSSLAVARHACESKQSNDTIDSPTINIQSVPNE